MFDKMILGKDQKAEFFPVCHMEGGDREETLFPGDIPDLFQGQDQVPVFRSHSEFIRFVGDGIVVDDQSAAQNAVVA